MNHLDHENDMNRIHGQLDTLNHLTRDHLLLHARFHIGDFQIEVDLHYWFFEILL
jgi:hypothetical protein